MNDDTPVAREDWAATPGTNPPTSPPAWSSPTWSASAPSWTPASPSANPTPAPLAGSAPVATANAGSSAKRTVGPGFVLAAVIGAAVLSSGGTYLAVSAAGNHQSGIPNPVVNPAVANPAPA
ncbi:MAG TPA: hypothetical protein VLR93_04270, partial [Patescibacteria group bacterium]|nr:hypothetical protein [Patescibacteria group bacterium]